MNRCARTGRPALWKGCLAGLLGLAAAVMLGCVNPQQARLQADDEAERANVKYDVKTVGDVSDVGQADPIPVGGVGLVTGLNGTGGETPPSVYRNLITEEFKKRNVKNYKELLNSPDTSIVIVSGQIPPGSPKGARMDIEVTLPPGSTTTSLRGGMLQHCGLFNYDSASNLSADPNMPNGMVKGHVLAYAEGPVQVGMGDGDDASKVRQGRVWGGGRSRIERSFDILLRNDQQYARIAGLVATRINETFHGPFKPAVGGGEIAVAKSNTLVTLTVPEQYQHNLPHFLRVVRLVPLREDPESEKAPRGKEAMPYRRRLEQDLLDPVRTVTAALRLEALGKDSIPTLKAGLSSEHALVRFTSAEAMAYLGSPASGQELGRLIEQQPALRAFSLTALASLNENVSHQELRRLLTSDHPEVRYGAFRALRALDERDENIKGELLADSFWVHRIAPNTAPLVHLCSSRRAEIILFGEEPVFKGPLALQAGEYTLTASDDDEHCTIGHVDAATGVSHRQCSLAVRDVLRTLAMMGVSYPEAVELLRQADSCHSLNCPVAVDALPQAVSVQALAKAGARGKDLDLKDAQSDDVDIRNANAEFGATPTIFDKSARRPQAAVERDEEVSAHDRREQAHGGSR
jgi:hypothetical protein